MIQCKFGVSVLGLLILVASATNVVAASSEIVHFSVGAEHTMFIKNDGSLWGFGHNSVGQLGISTTSDCALPTKVGSNFHAVSAGTHHTLAIKTDGSLWAWGYYLFGELGNGMDVLNRNGNDETYVSSPIAVDVGSKYIAISAGEYYSLGIKDDHSLWAWGLNNFSKLGDGSTENQRFPLKIGENYQAVAAGEEHTLALKTDGTLWAWGHDYQGEIGDSGSFGFNVIQTTPVQIGEHFKAIAAGGYNSLAIKEDGTLWAWGSEDDGRLGLGEDPDNPGYPATSNQTLPVQIPLSGNFVSIDIGTRHSVALQDNGDVWTWGNNSFGELGVGVANNDDDPNTYAGHANRFSPVLIGHDYTAVGAGHFNTLAVKNNVAIDGCGKVLLVEAGNIVEVDKYYLTQMYHVPATNIFPLAPLNLLLKEKE